MVDERIRSGVDWITCNKQKNGLYKCVLQKYDVKVDTKDIPVIDTILVDEVRVQTYDGSPLDVGVFSEDKIILHFNKVQKFRVLDLKGLTPPKKALILGQDIKELWEGGG